jgi:hypothetical protein
MDHGYPMEIILDLRNFLEKVKELHGRVGVIVPSIISFLEDLKPNVIDEPIMGYRLDANNSEYYQL